MTAETVAETIAGIEKLYAEATGGERTAVCIDEECGPFFCYKDRKPVQVPGWTINGGLELGNHESPAITEADAKLGAALHNAFPAIAEHVRELTAEVERLKGELAVAEWTTEQRCRENDLLQSQAHSLTQRLAAAEQRERELREALEKISKMDGPTPMEAFARCVDAARAALTPSPSPTTQSHPAVGKGFEFTCVACGAKFNSPNDLTPTQRPIGPHHPAKCPDCNAKAIAANSPAATGGEG